MKGARGVYNTGQVAAWRGPRPGALGILMTLSEVRRKYGITFKKNLGQNLLLDDNINRIMVDAASLGPEDHVVEVGAGLGALTRRMAPVAGKLLSIEIDRSFMPCLEEQFDDVENVSLFRGDVLNHEPEKLIAEYIPGGKTYKMVSNLPYYITTPILFHFWESSQFFERMVVMVQEEVGMRMVAPVGASDYGVLALAAGYYADVDIVHRVPASCFMPRPKVDSCIVRLRNRKEPAFDGVDRKFLMSMIRAAFSQRRKTLRNSLVKSGNFGAPKEAVLAAMEEVGIDPGRRPQTVSLAEFAALAASVRRHIS